jgi:hypothetical protein
MAISLNDIRGILNRQVHIAPLVTFRIVFGLMMAGSMIRFWAKGWIYDLYVAPKHFFTYYGFSWVKPLGEVGMYLLFAALIVSAICIALGAFYRFTSLFFFLGFTYVELIDKSNYLNHYYFISIVAALLVILPAQRYLSFDVWRNPSLKIERVPLWTIGVIKLQLGIVYFFAGIAKLNYDWLVRAMPLKLWLPAHSSIPVLGLLFMQTWVAFAFSWFGAIYDLCIPFFLATKKYRKLAYGFVVVFHVFTGWLFQIGMFPYIMIMATLIFFSERFHRNLLEKIEHILGWESKVFNNPKSYFPRWNRIALGILGVHFLVQVLFPFRYVFYEGNRFWHEQGFRFGWRVMLIEKAGTTFFKAVIPETGESMEIRNCDYLTANQEKMMSTQPDMIIQYAQIIKEDLEQKGYTDVEVKAEAYVTLNGSGTRPFINSEVNLAELEDNWNPKTWVLPFRP